MRCGRPNLLRFPPDTIRDLVVEGYEDGNFLAPTVLTGDAGPGIPAYDEEVFGPVLCCVTVETLEEAIQLVNSCTYGNCLLYTSPSPRDGLLSRMPSSA